MGLPVSVIIVSRGRPTALMRCLTGVSQLDYPSFEVVAVVCPRGKALLDERADVSDIKVVPFDEANISAARNQGITHAAGEVVAFIDDDAVPEPLWLTHLVAPFETEPDLAAAGGYVIGRNGISFQWQARSVDPTGLAAPLQMTDLRAAVLHPTPERAIKTEGTNMAVRRDVLAEMGGFDPAFRFFLDETDLNLRLARAGKPTAIVPLAQVHHGFLPSTRRARDRSPRSLFEIAASQQVFLRKHCPKPARDAAWARFEGEQRRRVLGFMQRGPFGADDVMRLMRSFRKGAADGRSRTLTSPKSLARATSGFRPYPGRPGAQRLRLSGRSGNAAPLRREAASRAASGAIVSLFLFDHTSRYHQVRFTDDGVWEQTGGLFGRSLRSGRLVQAWRFIKRVCEESQRIEPVRGQFSDTNP